MAGSGRVRCGPVGSGAVNSQTVQRSALFPGKADGGTENLKQGVKCRSADRDRVESGPIFDKI